MPPSLASLLAPGACVTSVVKSRPLRQQFDLLGADVGLARALSHVDERRLGGDLTVSVTPGERQREVDLLDLAEADADVSQRLRLKAAHGGGNDVPTGRD